MSDLDAELLALAGDSSDDDGQSEQLLSNDATAATPDIAGATKAAAAGATNGNGPAASPTADAKRASPTKSPTPKKRTLAAGDEGERVSKRTKRAESENDAASSRPSTSSSLQSAPMSESDSGTDPTGAKARMANVKVNGRSISEAEKAKIMELPEVQREALLADHATFKERDKQNRMLMQLLRGKDRKGDDEDEVRDKKRKADTAEMGDSQRRSTRQKTTLGGRKVGESFAPLDEYSKHREQKRVRAEQHKRKDANRRPSSASARPGSRSSADADGESVAGSQSGKGISPSQQATPPPAPTIPDRLPTLRDYNRCRLGRSNFGQVCLYPGFEEAITGCFVRVNIGNHPETGQSVYRMAQIKRFTEGERYAIAATTGRNFVTGQYALASHGKAEREWPFIMCSDSDFTEAEVDRFHRVCRTEEVPLPTARFVCTKIEGIHNLINRRWTEEELKTKLDRQGALRNGQASMHIRFLRSQRKIAVKRNNEDAIAKIDAQLSEFTPKLAFGTKLFPDGVLPPEDEEDEEEIKERRRKLQEAEDNERFIQVMRDLDEWRRTAHLDNQPQPKVVPRRHRAGRLVKIQPGGAQKPEEKSKEKPEGEPKANPESEKSDIDDLFEDREEESTGDTPADSQPTKAAKVAGADATTKETKPPKGPWMIDGILVPEYKRGVFKTPEGITMSQPSCVDDDEFLAAIDFGIEIPEL